MDTRTPEQRRRIMQSVRSRNTGPEIALRKALFAAGYRFRIHRKDLPGTPDIVFPARKRAIFVHGCFWHGHDCRKGKLPKSRTDYWADKIEANRARDIRNLAALQKLDWDASIVWQCEIAEICQSLDRISAIVEGRENSIDNRGGGS